MRQPSSLKAGHGREASGDLRASKTEKEILNLVEAGVERFILKNATIEDFFRTIQAVAGKEKIYSHQLTKSVFSRIVKAAIKKRNLNLPE